jgi:hypothetical protein
MIPVEPIIKLAGFVVAFVVKYKEPDTVSVPFIVKVPPISPELPAVPLMHTLPAVDPSPGQLTVKPDPTVTLKVEPDMLLYNTVPPYRRLITFEIV